MLLQVCQCLNKLLNFQWSKDDKKVNQHCYTRPYTVYIGTDLHNYNIEKHHTFFQPHDFRVAVYIYILRIWKSLWNECHSVKLVKFSAQSFVSSYKQTEFISWLCAWVVHLLVTYRQCGNINFLFVILILKWFTENA